MEHRERKDRGVSVKCEVGVKVLLFFTHKGG